MGRRQRNAAAAENRQVSVPEHAEAAPLDRHQVAGFLAAKQPVLAQPEERELTIEKPAAERDRLRQEAGRDRRRRDLQRAGGSIESGGHRAPVGHSHPHVFENDRQGLDEAVRRIRGHGVEQQQNPAFLRAVPPIAIAGANNALQLPLAGALNLQDRVQHQQGRKSARLQLVEDAVDEKRHVVVHDLNESERLRAGCRVETDRLPADTVPATRLGPREREARPRKTCERPWLISLQADGLIAKQQTAVESEICRRVQVGFDAAQKGGFALWRFDCHVGLRSSCAAGLRCPAEKPGRS